MRHGATPQHPRFSVLTALAFALLLMAALPASTHAQPREIRLDPKQTYTNSVTGFHFPVEVGDFQREAKCSIFDGPGTDIGISYNDLLRSIVATMFVYPIRAQAPDDTLEGHFASCKSTIEVKHDGAKLVSEGKAEISPGGQNQNGLRATYAYSDRFLGKVRPVRSELYVFTHGRAFVMFRFTYPASQQDDAPQAIKTFLDGLAWP